MGKTFIYALIDPNTEQIRYIGKADNPEKRMKRHLGFFEPQPTHKQNWIKSLVARGQKPILKILEEVDKSYWQESERKWITYYKEQGIVLTNTAVGGLGGWNNRSESGNQKIREKSRERMQKMWDEIKEEKRKMMLMPTQYE